jgi:hypothetical protein
MLVLDPQAAGALPLPAIMQPPSRLVACRTASVDSEVVFEAAEYHLYSALSRAACCDSAVARRAPAAFGGHRRSPATTRYLGAELPGEFRERAALVGAEIARIEGRELDAERLYEQAIRSARENEFVHNEAHRQRAGGSLSTLRAASRRSRRRTCETPVTAISVGAPMGRSGSSMSSIRT